MNTEFIYLMEIFIKSALRIALTVYSLLIAWVSVQAALVLVFISGIYYAYLSELTLGHNDDPTTTNYDYIIGMYV